ncbi:alanine dehydrogenase [Vibrio alginolyticus]|uniref:alanine dehydrogenase n=1 Tax=Vibrio alginolyticus TaxID=663 RepID=UPI001BD2032C|nr:hypothetical protein [Vibrio alginolyticus]MBS9960217.1 hypothetical protein [Vibrio alginolyticus]
MIIGVPKEIKNHEYRVGMIPASVRELISHGHQVLVETNAGAGIGFSDDDYIAVGASILPHAADVTILDRNVDTLRKLDEEFQGRAKVVYSTEDAIEKHVLEADLVIGAVLIPGAAAPKLVTKEHIAKMKPGAAVVDVAIDQGGCFETSHATTHADPTYIVDEVVHYCVANMPGAVARTSTFALNNATLPYIVKLANKGYREALLEDKGFLEGLNVIHGKVTCKEVAESFDLEYVEPTQAIAMFN